ncbi:MAG: hypothetical protein E7028_03900 [Planctomycetaceae bacterium]|nr:hypothetical protein [Planctomycetaceae bacterium]
MAKRILTISFLFFVLFLVSARVFSQNLDENGKLPRASAESQGISSRVLTRLIHRLNTEVTAPNSIMVLRHGKVVAEAWWPPHSPETTHACYSLSKSFASTAAGFAVAEGKLALDAKLTDLFANELPADFANPTPANKYEYLKKARLRDLLTMSCGHETEPALQGLFPLDFSKPEGKSWQQTFLNHPFKHEPGTFFRYNTAGTFMVSAAVQNAVGETIRDYLVPRLFEPLKIETPYWESSPNGFSKGGTGLFLRTEDIAKFGQFCLQRGEWNGKPLLPPEWFDEATAKHVSNGADPNSDWAQGYGFQFWRCRFNVYRGDGMFSQFMVAFPDQDAVVAMTSDSNGYQQILNILFEELLPAFRNEVLPEDPAAVEELKKVSVSLPVKDGQSRSLVLENLHFQSEILGRDMTFNVYLPNGYLTGGFDYPVLYLLHGGGDVGDAWLRKGDLKRIADDWFKDRARKAIIVMPYCEDGRWRNDFEGKNRYEEYFIKELIPYVESRFRCRKGREDRAVSGLSRGGYGALLYALRHPDLFGTCFAMSPSIRPHDFVCSMPEEEFLKLYRTCVRPNHQEGELRLTPFFLEHDILTMVSKVPEERKRAVRIFIDCGDDDHLVSGSLLLHLEMLKYGIPHELRVRDGAHNWKYWKDSLPMALDFFLK